MRAQDQVTSAEPDAGRGPILRFVLLFAVGMGLFELYWSTLSPDQGFWRGGYFQSYLEWNARLSSFLLDLMGYETTQSGTSIFGSGGAVDVRRGCDAVQPSVLFALAVLAFPAPWRARLIGAPLGVSILLAMNLVRIVTLFQLRLHFPAAFDPAHHWIWPMAFLLVAMALWILWAKRALGPLPEASA